MEPIKTGLKFIVRSSRPDLAEASNAPYIVVGMGGGPGPYTPSEIWNDKGSDAVYSVSIYRVPTPENYFIIGDYAVSGYEFDPEIMDIIYAVNEDPDDPVLLPPTGYTMMWSTSGTDSDAEGSIWQPVAPTGYVALGWVGQAGLLEPGLSNYMCVRADFLQVFNGTPAFIWDDRRSGADMSIALYTPGNAVHTAQLTFTGQPNYDSFNGIIYVFNDRIQAPPE
ncbi:Vps62-related protein [uncultured Chitinophaga sp.]|jgi:Plant protein of unknown function (DUF946).|uniref:Vps62-related protein n=1 Tax=uncultured Chitinophaga sp. TaxID=339340 RepID=UPI00262CD541|nr:Vps62-related protein [uncultured Chitinophaga sp.]